MSGFALCWRRDGSPVPPDLRAVIGAALARRHAGMIRERAGSDWVAWIAESAWAPGAEAALPLERGGWTGTGALRLDDRETLASRVRDAAGEGPRDDATLAWRSLEVWGDAAPERWSGDYAVAAVAPTRDRLIVACGTIGVIPCFHATAGAFSLVADDPSVLARIPGVDVALEERAVAEYLATGELLTPTITFRRGITRIPGGCTLVVRRDGTTRLLRHWAFPTPEVRRDLKAAAVIEEFRALVARSVADRIRGDRAALLLSGGLDSPLLAVAATDAGLGDRLHALTVSWRSLLPHDDEVEWASRVAGSLRLRHEVLEMTPTLGLSGDAPYQTAEPAPDAEPPVYRAVLARAAAIAPIAVIGEDLDLLLAAPTLVEQLRSDGPRRVAAAWRAYRAAQGRLPWIGLRQLPAFERLRDRRSRRAPRWLRRDLLSRNPLPEVAPVAHGHGRGRAARLFAQPTWANVFWNDAPPMSGAPVRVVLPLMDPRVMRFCLSLPAVPWTQQKFLARETLRGVLPPAVVARAKTPLRGYYEARVRAWRDLGVPREVPANVAAWVDAAVWHRIASASPDPDAAFATRRAIELSRWLAQPEPR